MSECPQLPQSDLHYHLLTAIIGHPYVCFTRLLAKPHLLHTTLCLLRSANFALHQLVRTSFYPVSSYVLYTNIMMVIVLIKNT